MTRLAQLLTIVLVPMSAVLFGLMAAFHAMGATRAQLGYGLRLPVGMAAAALVCGIVWAAGEFAERRRR